MTTDLPDPHACPHCGFAGLAVKWGETICGMCNAPRATATPGCPVRNAMLSLATDETFPKITADSIAEGEAAVRDGKWITLDGLRQELSGFDKFVADAARIMESAQARCESVIEETFEQSAEAVAKEHSEALRMLAESDKLVEEVFGPCITTETDEQRLAAIISRRQPIGQTIAEETARERKVHGGGPRVVGP